MFKYPKIYWLGHKDNVDIVNYNIYIEEKLDGSNIGIFKENNKAYIQSRKRLLNKERADNPLFNKVYKWFKSIDWSFLPEHCYLFGETLHNYGVIKYNKTEPFVLFDIWYQGSFIPRPLWHELSFYDILKDITSFVPLIDQYNKDYWANVNYLIGVSNEIISRGSIYSKGSLMEGVVIKGYDADYICRTAKYKSEVMTRYEGDKKVKCSDPLCKFVNSKVRVDTILHSIVKLKEEDKISNSPQDISVIVYDIVKDLVDEYKDQLFKALWKMNHRKVVDQVFKIVRNYYFVHVLHKYDKNT